MVSLYENEIEQNKGYNIEFLLDNLHENPIIEILSYPNNSYEITKNRLKQIIKEELARAFEQRLLLEGSANCDICPENEMLYSLYNTWMSSMQICTRKLIDSAFFEKWSLPSQLF
mgnify:CR=1 FL=1